MDYTLTHLIDSLQSTLKILKDEANAQLLADLHDHNKLPRKKLVGLASQAIDLLNETEQLLEPGSLVLADHFLGYVSSKCLSAAVQFDIPDILRSGPRSLSDLAIASNARPDRLGQVLRVLYNNGIFSFDSSSGTYRNNTTSSLLLSDHWTQWRNWVDLYGNEFYDMARGIPASCRKDAVRMPAQINFDTDIDMFTYFSDQGWLPRLHKTLSGGATAQAPGILKDYPWNDIANSTLLDIGGGGGGLVALILRQHKDMHAGILDLPDVIDHARISFHSTDGPYSDVGSRVAEENLIAGDFLKSIPSFEVYTMKWCLHDWDDSKAVLILNNIRSAILKGPKSRLVILESILKDGRMGRLSRYGDMTMMVSANGQERDEAQWRALAEQTGWRVRQIYPLRNSWPSAIELVPKWGSDTDTVIAHQPNGVSEAKETLSVSKNGKLENGISRNRTFASKMSYLEPWDTARGEPFYRSAPDEGFPSTNFKWIDHEVEITDARPNKDEYDLDKQGFAFFEDPKGLTAEVLEGLRANDKELVQTLYYPHIESFVKSATGASRVIIFDHTVRKRNLKMDSKENPNGQEQPATVVHCDQSAKGALRRLKQNISSDEDINAILKNRVKMMNVWRPLNGPVDNWPLAMMDYRSLSASNLHPCTLWRHQHEERGQTVAFSYAEGQEWYYLDGHRREEVTMIKIWDNKEDVVGKLCPHAAFEHPGSPPNALPRESVEVRCFAIWSEGEGRTTA